MRPSVFTTIGRSMWNTEDPNKPHRANDDATFRSLFGCSPKMCVTIWGYVNRDPAAVRANVRPMHLLWALHFLKLYNPLRAAAAMIGCTVKTYCKWIWIVLTALTNVEDVIVWENRNIGWRAGQSTCRISVDGTDFRIEEPRKPKFDKKWFSHKFKGPGVRYEVGIAIHTCSIVWINGPFECGEWPDIKIAYDGLIPNLDKGEKFIADNGYQTAGLFTVTPKEVQDDQQKKIHARVRARHEIVNGRFKKWAALSNRFRNRLDRHCLVFGAIAVITQLILREESQPFQL